MIPQRWQVTDSRSHRKLLDPDVFLNGSNPPPSDLLELSVWDEVMHLPDHASITTSNHHGSVLSRLHTLERGWVAAIGDSHDCISEAMVDVMDEFHVSIFLLLHGFYRQSIAALRSVIESTLIGAFLQLSGDRDAIRAWRSGGEFRFGQVVDKLAALPPVRGVEKCLRGTLRDDLFSRRTAIFKGGWSRRLYARLCKFSHSRPGSTNVDLWRSNGPIHVFAKVRAVAALYVETYTLAILLVRLARQGQPFPTGVPVGSESSRARWARLARKCSSLL